jgi:hypothetical protein
MLVNYSAKEKLQIMAQFRKGELVQVTKKGSDHLFKKGEPVQYLGVSREMGRPFIRCVNEHDLVQHIKKDCIEKITIKK